MLSPPKLFNTLTKKPEVGLIWKIFCSRALRKRKKIWWRPLRSPPRLAKGAPKTARIAKVEQFLDFFLFSMELLDFWYNYCHLVLVNTLQLQYKAQELEGPLGPIRGALGIQKCPVITMWGSQLYFKNQMFCLDILILSNMIFIHLN